MKQKSSAVRTPKTLRGRAEAALGRKARDLELPPKTDVQKLVYDLQVHQVELEMQNDELRRAQQALEEARDRFSDLYDFAPCALLTVDERGELMEANLAAAGLLGADRADLIHQKLNRFIQIESRDTFSHCCREVFRSGTKQTCELTLKSATGMRLIVRLEGIAAEDLLTHKTVCRLSLSDVTEAKSIEARREVTHSLLALFARKNSRKEYLEGVVEVLRGWTGCQCLGIRVVDEEGRIPYGAALGFPAAFLQSENQLSLKTDTCCCIRAISQAIDAEERALVTPAGSYCCDDAVAFTNKLPPERRASHWGNCVKFGYSSLAVVPLRYREQIIGVIHLADRRPGLFTSATVEFLESMTPLIGDAVRWFETEAKLADYRDHLAELVQKRTRELEAANEQLRKEVANRKVAELALLHVAEDLKRSNQDLEQFGYVASHDLQEPLRAVAGYVRLIEHRFPEQVDAKTREYIAGAAEGATRMERLITDLLTFSRLSTNVKPFKPANLEAPLKAALRNLSFKIQAAKATVTIDPLPTLPVDESQILQLFQNLIGNALKFHGECPLQIHIGARPEPDTWVLWVRDNGIGIDPQYFERIFQVFQRLHTRKTYPGTGIGLAICKKIVERHGGKIWVESQPSQGATFYFSLPKTLA